MDDSPKEKGPIVQGSRFTRSVSRKPLSERDSWDQSRSGAWAGRGFDYQHMVTVLVLLRQWAKDAPLGAVVPEGLDDCVIELADRRIWLQIKSRKDGRFRESEILKILGAAEDNASRLPSADAIRHVVVLEQTCVNRPDVDISHLFDDEAGRVFICPSPEKEISQLLLSRQELAPVIAQGLVSDLYKMVADASAENASLSFEERRKISPTEVERRIFERLEAEDPTAIDDALLSGVLEPIDFSTPVNEPNFYRGVKVEPGHIAAKLVQDRPKDVARVLEALWQHRHVLVSGPSGAGKSALTWLAATAAADRMWWYRITGIATATDIGAIVRFVRARQPIETSPLGLVFDEIGSANSDLWNALAGELRGFPDLYLLGSLRQEDVNLIANRSDIGFVSVVLDHELAAAVWEILTARKTTEWRHWREPFEQSEGLMLEYMHILVQGQRLVAVIEDQVRQREREGRDDELGIIRCTSVLCARGGEVDADRMFELLNLTPDDANRALRRLIDEHLVRESRPGVLGGLHMLRTDALVRVSHDETVFRASDSLWNSLAATTVETLPRVIHSLFADPDVSGDPSTLSRLAGVLAESRDVDRWTAMLTGLGLATLDRHVTSLTSILDRHGLEHAHWSLAASFTDPLVDIPQLGASDQWMRLSAALSEFRNMPKHDLRAECLSHLPAGTAPPDVTGIPQADALFSALMPICGGEAIRVAIDHEYLVGQALDIHRISKLLASAYMVDSDLARRLVEILGGEHALFDVFCRQIPWVTPPEIDPVGPHGRTVRSNWHHVSEKEQPDPHATVCEICEILIAISPNSDAAACDAVDPAGQVITVGDHRPWSKNIPRSNLPAKPRVAWNVAFRQILLVRSTIYSLTDYTHRMAGHVRYTEKIFRSFSEKWIRGKRIPNADALASEIERIVDAVNALGYTAPETAPATMTEPFSAGSNDTLGALLTGVLGNLVGRMSKIDTPKAMAAFAADLHGQAREHHQSAIWRTMSSPPLPQLDKLAERLRDVSSILHEMAEDGSPDAIARIVGASKKASIGKAIRTTAQRVCKRALSHFETRTKKLELALASRGWKARCLSRPLDELDSPFWPAREVAILVEVENLADQWLLILEGLPSVAVEHLGRGWPCRAVPVMNGQILVSLAFAPTSDTLYADQMFAEKWCGSLDQPILSSKPLEVFGEAVEAVQQASAIINSRGTSGLHPDEDDVLFHALHTFENKRTIIEKESDNRPEAEHYALALDYLNGNCERLSDEIAVLESGQPVGSPLWMTPYLAISGYSNEDVANIAAVRLYFLQTECNGLVAG